jgi:murein DD-endopeptidase MepM/ murein hydrolase activator NlpD
MISHLGSFRVRLAAMFALVALLPWAPSGAGAATTAELRATQDRIEQTIAELQAVESEAERTEEQVAAASARVAQLEEDLNALLAQLQAQEERVAGAEAAAREAADEQDRIQRIVGERARRAFMGATPDPILLLGTGGMSDVSGALDSLAMLDALAGRADASIETLDSARVRSIASAERLATEIAALEEVRAAREAVLSEAQVVLAQRAQALSSIEQEQDALLAEQEQLESEEAEIEAIIAREAEAARKRAAEKRRQAEEAAAAAASGGSESADQATNDPSPPASSGCYGWPARGAVTSGYGPRWGRMHSGIDIDGNTGDSLYAAQSGRVIYAGRQGGYGNLTLISHSDGVTTAYAHQSSIGVRTGQSVSRGDYIGRMGATGNVTGSHLHFETRTSSGARNPRNYLC